MYGVISLCSMMVLAVTAGGESEPLLTRLCGRYLSDTLIDVCKGVFNSWPKKSHAGALFPIGLDDYWQPAEAAGEGVLPWPWRRRPAAAALLQRGLRRKRQGVYNECCEKRCSLDELKNYCGQ